MPEKKQVHICHIIYALKTGGLENGLVNLINRLPEEQFRHSIICLTDYDDFAARINRQGVEIVSLHKKQGQDFGLFLKVYKVLKRLKPDIVHTRNMTAIEMQFPALFAGVKTRIHGEHGWDISDPEGKNTKYQWLRKICNLVIHRFIPLSKELEQYLTDVIHVSPKKITRICNGVDAARFVVGEKKHKDLLPENAKKAVVIGYVGRMEAIKNPQNLAQAFIQLHKKQKKKVFLVMVGQGSEYEGVANVLTEQQLNNQSWLAGDCSNVAELMQQFDIFCLPSNAEGISNTLLEAMASGLPVVATNVGGNADIAVEGETALLVNSGDSAALADALARYVEDESLRQAHGQAGRLRIEKKLSLEQMVLNYKTMYLDESKNVYPEVA
ncbi:MAG: sugar transferase [Piscirickettsiaceae bacterium]|nr:MAG: sugar transferase [Piscirickettsiaceae bacterium]